GVITLSYNGTQASAPLVPKTEVQQLELGGTDGGIVRLSYNGVIGSEATRLTFKTGISPTAADVLAHLSSIPSPALTTTGASETLTLALGGTSGGSFTPTFNGNPATAAVTRT